MKKKILAQTRLDAQQITLRGQMEVTAFLAMQLRYVCIRVVMLCAECLSNNSKNLQWHRTLEFKEPQ